MYYQSTLNYLKTIGCAEHYDAAANQTEYWFRVREGGRWNGKWSKGWKGTETKTTEELAHYITGA